MSTLRVFIAVAEARGFAAASRRLRVSAPAVTRAIAALEQRLGVQLLQRNTRRVRLTEVGERYAGDCRRIVADLGAAEAAAAGAQATAHGTLRITASAVVVASPDHLARHGRPSRPADLADRADIGHAQDGAAVPPWTFADGPAAPPPRFRLVTNSNAVAIDAAVRGHGFARALRYQVEADVAAGRLEIVLADSEPAPVPVHLVHAAGRGAGATRRTFIDLAVERLRAEPVLRT